ATGCATRSGVRGPTRGVGGGNPPLPRRANVTGSGRRAGADPSGVSRNRRYTSRPASAALLGRRLQIHAYTRADALCDGVLIDVPTPARDVGFTYPVALTAAAWSRCVEVPPGVLCQDEAGRLWDVLTMLRVAAGRPSDDPQEVRFAVHVRNDNRERTPPLV